MTTPARRPYIGLYVESEATITQARVVNPAFGRIIDEVLPDVVSRFATKSLDYGDAAEELGARAQFVDINRKMGKLRRALWLGLPLVDEQPIEVLEDMVAHCLLTIDFLRREEAEPAKVTGEGLGEDMMVPGPLTTEDLCDDPNCPRGYAHNKKDHQ